MRGPDIVFFKLRDWVVRIAVLASATALPACALGDEDSAGESSANAPLTVGQGPTFDLNGIWTDFGFTRPVISEMNGSIRVDMSSNMRRMASGSVIDLFTISVSFPDDGTFTGTLRPPNVIEWSNRSTWEKVFTGNLAIPLGGFADGARIIDVSATGGFIEMRSDRRPTAHGFAISATKIKITFPDDATYVGTLEEGVSPSRNVIRWDNKTEWRAL